MADMAGRGEDDVDRITTRALELAALHKAFAPGGGDQSLIVPVQVCVGGRVERVGIEIAGRFHPRSQKA